LLRIGERVVRTVNRSAEGTLDAFLKTDTVGQFCARGAFVKTHYLSCDEARQVLSATGSKDDFRAEARAVVEHERIPFPSFPYEWPPEMLAAGGDLTLDLAESLVEEGFGLKDATPYPSEEGSNHSWRNTRVASQRPRFRLK
jgi:hypothetical protein